MIYHAYIDKSKRKPYICGHPGCGRDITHPVHQPSIAGLFYVPEPEPDPPPLVYVDAWPEEALKLEPQLALFDFAEVCR